MSQQSGNSLFRCVSVWGAPFYLDMGGKEMYILTEEQWENLKASADRLSSLRLLLPDALDYAAHGNEKRKEALLEMVAEMDKPQDLHQAICAELEQLHVILSQIKTHHI